jgi:hypothetical protein
LGESAAGEPCTSVFTWFDADLALSESPAFERLNIEKGWHSDIVRESFDNLKGGIIMIEVGKQAPDFELASHLGGTKFTLGQFKGQKNVMLVFYPLDWTPT